jgi:hypothetical protein
MRVVMASGRVAYGGSGDVIGQFRAEGDAALAEPSAPLPAARRSSCSPTDRMRRLGDERGLTAVGGGDFGCGRQAAFCHTKGL